MASQLMRVVKEKANFPVCFVLKANFSSGYRKNMNKRIRQKSYIQEPHEAIRLMKAFARGSFDETVEISVQLGVDPRKPNQNIRGVVQFPYGTGKKVRIAVFARGELAEEAKNAGADVVGAEDLIQQIQDGQFNFDKCIATPDMMPLVGRVGRILGPRGLMPNPKLGSVTRDVANAIKATKAGQADFRVEKCGIVHAGIGKTSFPTEHISSNMKALMLTLSALKPQEAKSTYFLRASISSTQGLGFPIDVALIDPTSTKCTI